MVPPLKEELPLHVDQTGTNRDPSLQDDGATTVHSHPEPVQSLSPIFQDFPRHQSTQKHDGVFYLYSTYTVVIEPTSGKLVQMDIAIHLPPQVCGYVGTFRKAGQEAQVSVHDFQLVLIQTRKFDCISL